MGQTEHTSALENWNRSQAPPIRRIQWGCCDSSSFNNVTPMLKSWVPVPHQQLRCGCLAWGGFFQANGSFPPVLLASFRCRWNHAISRLQTAGLQQHMLLPVDSLMQHWISIERARRTSPSRGGKTSTDNALLHLWGPIISEIHGWIGWEQKNSWCFFTAFATKKNPSVVLVV